MVATDGYVLGHTDAELKRLAAQARLIDPITRRFLVSAGISEGMRVLDVGSGAGDVAILLAGLVGPTGEVVGTDPCVDAQSTPRKSASARPRWRMSRSGMATRRPWYSTSRSMLSSAGMSCSSSRTRPPRSARLSDHLRPGGRHVFP